MEVKAPKALLQQHCQKKGLPPPRFDKRDFGGERGPVPGVRYSVTLEAPVQSGPRKKGARRPAPRTFTLREADDGWDTVQEAQNAAAARALFEVIFRSVESVWKHHPRIHKRFLCAHGLQAQGKGGAGKGGFYLAVVAVSCLLLLRLLDRPC